MMHSFDVNIMICQPENSDVHRGRAKGEVGALLNWFKPSSKIFLLTVPRGCFFCGSFMIYLSCFCNAYMHVCLLLPCGHLLGKD